MTSHAKLSASGSTRWMNCPGSVELEDQFPDVENEYASYGTNAHKLAEYCLTHELVAHEYPKDNQDIEVDDEMIAGVQEYLNFVRSLTGECFIEQRVDFSPWVPGGFGTADLICIDDNTLTVVDLKFGKGIRIFAEDNTQGILYALGAWHEYGFMFNIETIKIVIVQPRLDHVDEWEIDLEDLKVWGNVIRERAEVALSEDAPLIPGEDQCRFCRAKGACRALAEHNVSLAAQDFSTLEEPVKLSNPLLLDNEEIGVLLHQTQMFSDWIKALEGHALEEMLAGREIHGFKLVEGRSLRTWKDASTAVYELESFGLTDEELYSRKLQSPAQVEKVFKSKKINQSLIEQLITKPPGKTTFAPVGDKRPAIQPSITTDFVKVA